MEEHGKRAEKCFKNQTKFAKVFCIASSSVCVYGRLATWFCKGPFTTDVYSFQGTNLNMFEDASIVCLLKFKFDYND